MRRCITHVAALSLCRASHSKCTDTPNLTWQPTQEVQHVYTTQEFERQVFGRLQSQNVQLQRLSQWSLSSEKAVASQALRVQWENVITNSANVGWKPSKQAKNVGQPLGPMSLECDMVYRVDGADPLSVSNFVKDVACEHHVLWGMTPLSELCVEPGQIFAGEVAETPESLKDKLWQLERLLQYCPEMEERVKVCAVFLNGEALKTKCVSDHVATLFKRLQDSNWKIAKKPTFVFWTPFRNTYAELSSLTTKLDQMEPETNTNLDQLTT